MWLESRRCFLRRRRPHRGQPAGCKLGWGTVRQCDLGRGAANSANLSGSGFFGANLEGATFESRTEPYRCRDIRSLPLNEPARTNLTGATLTGSRLVNARFMPDEEPPEIDNPCAEANQARSPNMVGVGLNQADLTGAQLKGGPTQWSRPDIDITQRSRTAACLLA